MAGSPGAWFRLHRNVTIMFFHAGSTVGASAPPRWRDTVLARLVQTVTQEWQN
jgi:hypothetical protein